MVYLLLAGCLFADLGYRQVWAKLVAGLRGLPVPDPCGSASRQARQRLGVAPLRALFDVLRGPAATSAVGQVRWRALLPVVIDGTVIAVLPGTQVHHPRRPGPTRTHPRRRRPGNPRPADRLPTTRTATVDATDSRPGLDPDRASFTTALNAARDQVVQAAGVIADTTIDLVGVIGERVLANLLPDRRIRTKTRMIKRSNSKYQARARTSTAAPTKPPPASTSSPTTLTTSTE